MSTTRMGMMLFMSVLTVTMTRMTRIERVSYTLRLLLRLLPQTDAAPKQAFCMNANRALIF